MASDMNMLLEKASNGCLLEVDITYTLQIVDLIRQGDVSAKVAVQCIFNRLKDKNPNVVLMTLQVLEFVVKNCGEAVHEEVCSRSGCEALEELVRTNPNEEVRTTACNLVGRWCTVFRDQSKLQPIQDLANILRAKGHNIPQTSEAAALYCSDAAPDWAEGNCCNRCRSNFTLLKRKHHCRACGDVFCHECSSRTSIIPKYGFEKEVRVCETCYHEINSPAQAPAATKSKSKDDISVSPAKKAASTPSGKTEAELQEEEELQLALALSKSEAENKEKEKLRVTSSLLSGSGWRNNNTSSSSAPPRSPSPPAAVDHSAPSNGEDPELAKYLNRPYWEQQKQQQRGSTGSPSLASDKTAGVARDDMAGESVAVMAASPPSVATLTKAMENLQTNSDDGEVREFVSNLRTQLEIFVNRMKSNQSRGRLIANDTAVQSLFNTLTTMHSQLLHHLRQQEERRVWCERQQDKLGQLRDARAALEALREEHRERERRMREEQQRIRQMQMMQKLEVMRKKKQEYLEYQRQLAVHRMAQTERQLMQHPQQLSMPANPGMPTSRPAEWSNQPPTSLGAPPPQSYYGPATSMAPPLGSDPMAPNMGPGQPNMLGYPVMQGYPDPSSQQFSPYLYHGPQQLGGNAVAPPGYGVPVTSAAASGPQQQQMPPQQQQMPPQQQQMPPQQQQMPLQQQQLPLQQQQLPPQQQQLPPQQQQLPPQQQQLPPQQQQLPPQQQQLPPQQQQLPLPPHQLQQPSMLSPPQQQEEQRQEELITFD